MGAIRVLERAFINPRAPGARFVQQIKPARVI